MTSTAASTPIPRQVTLPFSVAFEVVAQGLRIRFGRSVVTLSGVVCGIAFLMSIFTGIVLKGGVGTEEALRIEANRMFSFLIADAGPPAGHTMGLIADGPLTSTEERLLQKLSEQGLAELRVAAPSTVSMPSLSGTKIELVPVETVGQGASAVLWTSEKTPSIGWPAVFQGARQNVVALTRSTGMVTVPESITLVSLASTPTEEQKARAGVELKKTRFRNGWIITISLLVTIIGIANAMLMSVTERFREIGTMKCLGALSAFVREMFLIESGLMGLVGGLIGSLAGLLFSLVAYMLTYGASLTFLSLWHGFSTILLYSVISISSGLVLSILAALYPASVASNMVPAHALRSNI